MLSKIKDLFPVFFSGTARDTYLIFTSNIFTSFLAFLYTILLARSFTPSVLGIFSAVTAFILLTSDVLDLGISTSLSRFYPEIKEKKGQGSADSFAANTFKFQLLVTLLAVFIIIAAAWPLARIFLDNSAYFFLYILAGIGILGTVLTAFSTSLFAARKDFLPVAVVGVSSTLIKLLFLVILFYLNFFTLPLVVSSFIGAVYIAFIICLPHLKIPVFREKFSLGKLKKLLSYSVYIALSRIFSAVSGRLDALMLIPLSSAFEAGIYSAAYKIAFTYILLSGSFSMVIAPRLSAFPGLGQALPYLKKIILVVCLILATMIVMYFIAPAFVIIIFGSRYAPSAEVFRALLLPMALFVATIAPVNILLYVLKKPQILTANSLLSLILVIFGNLIFIPRAGRFGPVYTLTLSYGFTLVISTVFTFYFWKRKSS